jgi:hypothetical protein
LETKPIFSSSIAKPPLFDDWRLILIDSPLILDGYAFFCDAEVLKIDLIRK